MNQEFNTGHIATTDDLKSREDLLVELQFMRLSASRLAADLVSLQADRALSGRNNVALLERCVTLTAKCDALKAKLKALEGQEPIGEIFAYQPMGTFLMRPTGVNAPTLSLGDKLYLAAGAAPASAAVLEGWKLVPIEPTEKMNRAGDDYAELTSAKPKGMWWWGRVYEAMLAAAPQPPTSAKPLTDEQIIAIRKSSFGCNGKPWADTLWLARAIEAAHGIKE